jgi:Family of unknown function (DUF6049)
VCLYAHRMKRWCPLVVAVALAVASPLGGGIPARAQTPGPSEPTAILELVRQPVSHSPEDRLGLALRVTNTSDVTLEGFRIQVLAYTRVLSRSDLHQSYEGPTGLFGSQIRFYDQVSVAPGSSTVIHIDNPLTDLQTISRSTEGGVFPLSLTLLDVVERPLDSFTTHLIYYPQVPEIPLNLSLVLPLNDLPSRGPDGAFIADGEGSIPLAHAVGPDGWLSVWLDALEDRGGSLELGIAPVPRLIEELADLSDGFRYTDSEGEHEAGERSDAALAATTALETLRTLLRRPGIQPLFVPYSFPDLPSLHARFSPADVVEQRQFAEAELVYTGALDIPIRPRWLYPPAGRLDRPALERVRALGSESARYTFFAPQSLVGPDDPATAGCPVQFASFACPVSVTTVEGPAGGFVADEELQTRLDLLARPGAERLDLQRFLAETAMIREELPGTGERVIHAVIPATWRPSPRIGRLFVAALAQAPWLKTLTPAHAMKDTAPPIPREVVPSLPAPANLPDASFFSAISSAEDVLDGFRDIGPPPELARRLDRNILVAQSRTFWTDDAQTDDALDYALDSRDEVEAELAKISIVGSDVITLTSQRGEIQLVVSNATDYPVSLDLVINSRLEVEPPEVSTFEPGTTRVNLEVSAATSGVTSVTISLRTREGFPVGSAKVIQVRSTALNEVALAVTLGALLFLILFYAWRSLRRRGHPAETPSAA